jgi:hypothetical protein
MKGKEENNLLFVSVVRAKVCVYGALVTAGLGGGT